MIEGAHFRTFGYYPYPMKVFLFAVIVSGLFFANPGIVQADGSASGPDKISRVKPTVTTKHSVSRRDKLRVVQHSAWKRKVRTGEVTTGIREYSMKDAREMTPDEEASQGSGGYRTSAPLSSPKPTRSQSKSSVR